MTEHAEIMPQPVQQLGWFRLAWEFVRARGNVYRAFVRLHAKYGNSIQLPFALPALLVQDGADLRHVLVVNADNYEKLGALVLAKKLLGEGLLTSNGAPHRRTRRAMQPLFHRNAVKGFSDDMVASALRRSDTWNEGDVRDMALEMMHITSTIISNALFSIDLEHEAHELSHAIVVAQQCIVERILTPVVIPYVTAARERRYEDAVTRVDQSLLAIIRERMRPSAPPQQDMLDMLLQIRFDDGEPMSETEIRDEIITIFLAGHETSAVALTWALHLLQQNPEALARLHQELNTVLAGRHPTLSDVANLPYTHAVIWETLRLYPPVWMLGRFVREDDTLPSGIRLNKGTQVLMVPWATHRNPHHFPDPEAFKPERFFDNVGLAQGYFPFSTGIRACAGEAFAKIELVLVLATLCQRFTFSLEPGQDIRPGLLLVSRPRDGIRMRATRRAPRSDAKLAQFPTPLQ
jgi:cytochrome P450